MRRRYRFSEWAGVFVVSVFVGSLSAVSNGFAQPTVDDLVQFAKSAADDEKDVPRVDRSAAGVLAALQVHDRLHLAQQIALAEETDVRLFHQLEKVDLHSAAGHIFASGRRS